jgi:hypothetical protein
MFFGSGLAVDATQDSKKYAGAFMISAEGVSGVRAEQLEQAVYEVIEDLKTIPVAEDELQKVKNRLNVQRIRFMDIMSGIGIVFYLGANAAMGDWTEANEGPRKLELVTAEDVRRVANEYFADDQRNVLIINPEADRGDDREAGEDPRFAQFVQMIKSATDAARLEQMMGMLSVRLEGLEDPDERAKLEELLGVAARRLEELKSAGE